MSFLPTFFNKSAQLQHYKLLTCLTTYSGSVYALAISNDGNLLACGGTKGIKIWDIKSWKELTSSSHHHESQGTSVVFADNRDVYVFGLYDGNFMKLKDEDGSVVQEMSCKSVIGHAAVHSKQGIFIMDNAADGFTLYCLEGDSEPVQMFATAVPSMSLPKQVAFGEEGKVVVGGSDNGLIYVFNWKTGQILETLHHADTDSGLTCDLHGCCTIASASTAPGHGKTTIKLWVYDYTVQKASAPKAPSENYWFLSYILMMLTQLLALLCMSVFLLINYKDSFLDSTVNRVHVYMTSATIVNVADKFSQHVKAAMKFSEFSEYVDIKDEGSIKHDIRMLQELAAKLMEIAQEAGGEINKDEGKHNTDHPQAAKGDEWTKSLTIVQ
ncbi:WD40 repeat-like protein [Suillus weaverae]|nr:WD40 repeat-like protein [Suillus weaverae]